jgi:hypothetical protein
VAGVLFDKSQTTLIQYPPAKGGISYAIPTSVTIIGDWAFVGCSSLTNITIPTGVTGIGERTFSSCGLTHLTVPTSVTSIGDGAFESCSSLTSITISNGVTSIGDNAFYFCTSLTSITIPNSVTSIGDGAFDSCYGLTNITISDSVTNIGVMAFWCSSLTSITIPNGVTSIGNEAFVGCYNLVSVYFQGNAPRVGPAAFSGDVATVYYLPGTTGWDFFAANTGLPTVLWNPQAQTRDGSFGVQANQFGFNITGSSNLVIVVEACTNFSNPAWLPVSTNTLNTFIGTNGTSYFSDPQWTNYPGRFYRLRSP